MNKTQRKENLLPQGTPRYVRCYDNGGETADRYTVVQKFGDCIECKNPLEIFAFNKKKQNLISKGTQTRDSI